MKSESLCSVCGWTASSCTSARIEYSVEGDEHALQVLACQPCMEDIGAAVHGAMSRDDQLGFSPTLVRCLRNAWHGRPPGSSRNDIVAQAVDQYCQFAGTGEN